MKSLLFLCSSGWQGHNLFYDLLGRVAVLYSSLKDTFNNRSNKTPLKKTRPSPVIASSINVAVALATQKAPNHSQEG